MASVFLQTNVDVHLDTLEPYVNTVRIFFLLTISVLVL